MSRRGVVRVKLSCPPGRPCAVRLRLRRHGHRIAGTRATVPAGRSVRVPLRLERAARRQVRRAGTLRAMAVATSPAHPTVRREIRLLAPSAKKTEGDH